MIIELSDAEKHVIRHALGFQRPSTRRAYRNNFSTSIGSADDQLWQGLVERGLAVTWTTDYIPGNLYAVLEPAARVAKKRHEGFRDEVLEQFKRMAASVARRKVSA